MSKAAAFCTAEFPLPHSIRTECEAKEGSQYHSEEGTSCTEDADCCRDVACVDSGQWSACLAAVLRSCNVERQGIFWLASISAACHCTVKVCSSSRGYACLPGLHALSPTVHTYPPSKLSADTYWLAVYNSDDTLLYFSVRWAYLQPAALFWEVVQGLQLSVAECHSFVSNTEGVRITTISLLPTSLRCVSARTLQPCCPRLAYTQSG